MGKRYERYLEELAEINRTENWRPHISEQDHICMSQRDMTVFEEATRKGEGMQVAMNILGMPRGFFCDCACGCPSYAGLMAYVKGKELVEKHKLGPYPKYLEVDVELEKSESVCALVHWQKNNKDDMEVSLKYLINIYKNGKLLKEEVDEWCRIYDYVVENLKDFEEKIKEAIKEDLYSEVAYTDVDYTIGRHDIVLRSKREDEE